MYKNSTRHKSKRHDADYDLYADLEKIKDAFGDTARDVKGKAASMITETFDNARETGTQIQDNVIDYIQAKPFKAVGIAMLAGALLTVFMRRK